MPTYYPRCVAHLSILLEDFKGGSDGKVHDLRVVPRSCEYVRNHHRAADTFQLELNYRDLPLDPRAMRSILVALYLGDVEDPIAEIPEDDDRFRVFLGYADEPETALSEDGETVSIKGRDLTALFLDHRWSGGTIDISRPLHQVVDEIVRAVPGAASLAERVVFDEGADEAVLADRKGRTKYVPRDGDDAWTVLVELCGQAGFVAVMDLDRLRIQPASMVGGQEAAFLFGQNLTRLVFRKNFVEARSSQIEVRCWNEQTRETTTALYPATPPVTKQKVGADGKVATETTPALPFYVSGAYTQADLDAIARATYDEMAREQMDGTLETREMLDLAGTVRLPLLMNGDTLTVTLADWDLASIASMSSGEAQAALVALGLDEEVASALVAAWQEANDLSTTFYVRAATHRWSLEDGYALSVEFKNQLLG